MKQLYDVVLETERGRPILFRGILVGGATPMGVIEAIKSGAAQVRQAKFAEGEKPDHEVLEFARDGDPDPDLDGESDPDLDGEPDPDPDPEPDPPKKKRGRPSGAKSKK